MHFQFRGEKCAAKTPSLKVTNHCTNLLLGFWDSGPMNRQNRPLVTDEPIEVEKQPVGVQDCRKKSPIVLKESIEHASN